MGVARQRGHEWARLGEEARQVATISISITPYNLQSGKVRIWPTFKVLKGDMPADGPGHLVLAPITKSTSPLGQITAS